MRKGIERTFIMSIAIFLLLGIPLHAASAPFHTPFIVKGHVYDGGGEGLGGVTVVVKNLRTQEVLTGTTDASGKFTITLADGVEDGDAINVTASKDGSKAFKQKSVPDSGAEGIIVNVHFPSLDENDNDEDEAPTTVILLVGVVMLLVAITVILKKRGKGA